MILQVYAKDSDSGSHASLVYNMKTKMNNGAHFSIHPHTGVISTSDILFAGNTYDLLVSFGIVILGESSDRIIPVQNFFFYFSKLLDDEFFLEYIIYCNNNCVRIWFYGVVS